MSNHSFKKFKQKFDLLLSQNKITITQTIYKFHSSTGCTDHYNSNNNKQKMIKRAIEMLTKNDFVDLSHPIIPEFSSPINKPDITSLHITYKETYKGAYNRTLNQHFQNHIYK